MTEQTETSERSGQCLCGAVRLTATHADNHVSACHCASCRRWSGGPQMAINCGSSVSIEGQEHVAIYDSSRWAERGFCSKCGSNLFYRLKGNGEHHVLVGIFDDFRNLNFTDQYFIEEKPAFYEFTNQTKNMTGAELFARVLASKEAD